MPLQTCQSNLVNYDSLINFQPTYCLLDSDKNAKKEHALIVASPGIGYFSVKNMETLFVWAHENFYDFNVFLADEVSIYNYLALGYDKRHALEKTKKNDSGLRCKVTRSLMNLGYSSDDARNKILFLSQLSKQNDYIRIYNYYVHIFETNVSFRNDCLGATREILSKRIENVSEDATYLAVKYLLAELPLWLDSPGVLGVHSSVLVYRQFSLFWKRIFYNHNLHAPTQELCAKCVEE